MSSPESNTDITKHREWLSQVRGTVIPEIMGAKPMQGFEGIPLGGLVVDDDLGTDDWEHIKQPMIPLKPATTDTELAIKAARELRMLRAQIISDDGFLALVRDEQVAGKDGWALSIIIPSELSLSQEKLSKFMEVGYISGSPILGSSSRAALLATKG